VQLTVVGCGTAATDPATPASGLLIGSAGAQVLLDCGPGVVDRLGGSLDPTRLTAIVITHLHFDHFLDLVPLRYLLPWSGRQFDRPRIYLPPVGRERIAALEAAISERVGFFDAAMDVAEFDPSRPLRVPESSLELRFEAAPHYVPAWSVAATDQVGTRLVYGGDSGPTEELVAFARGADLLILEATLGSAGDDDSIRGHLTAQEAIAIVERSDARQGLLVHFPWHRRAELQGLAAQATRPVMVGEPGLVVAVPALPLGSAA
jgi:ribonuclease BN (tRNA processing enzyme)